MRQELICITCPLGCRLVAERGPGDSLAVSGNRCQRGAGYAREELLSPKRCVTASIRLARGEGGARGASESARRLPCRTNAPFPRELVPQLLELIYSLEARVPVSRGQVLARNALGTGIDLIATRTFV
jgi:CxxC motif-containing protein